MERHARRAALRVREPVLVAGWLLLAAVARPAGAQVLVAVDDDYGIPFGAPLVVGAYGVLDNDTLDGENAGEGGATAQLVADVAHGTLALAADGSFSYSPDSTFDGTDQFVYRATFAAASDQATVTLGACTGGPTLFDCWNESAFLAKAAELGYGSFVEGFEDDAAWGGTRYPATAATVVSQGIEWWSNHPDPPASNGLATGPGPARSGLWGLFDPDHGYATGTPTQCDVDVPPATCLYHDGFTGIREPGLGVLHGVGGWISGTYGANVAIALDGGAPAGGGKITFGHQFFGRIDAGAGFTRFELREQDGKVGQALYVFGDDFTLLTPDPTGIGIGDDEASGVRFPGAAPNPSGGGTTLRFALPANGRADLSVFDLRGRRVRRLATGVRGGGWHEVTWDGRDGEGAKVAAGVYFGRLTAEDGRARIVRMRKIVVTR